jgi:hypothetical protein
LTHPSPRNKAGCRWHLQLKDKESRCFVGKFVDKGNLEFKPEFRFETTNLLARVVEKWDEVPIGLLQHLDLRKSLEVAGIASRVIQ